MPINDILSFVQPDDNKNYIYACGFAFQDMTNEAGNNKYASMFKMSTDGAVQYIRRWGQYRVQAPSSFAADICSAIQWDSANRQVVLLLEAHSPNLRQRFSSSSLYNTTDMVIVRL